MPIIKLPDGNKIDFPNKVTGIEIAEKISKSLAKQALIISVDGELKDLTHIIEKDSSVKIITHKDSDGLDAIRHDTTHIMAMAVQDLFPGTKLAIGPAIKDGFFIMIFSFISFPYFSSSKFIFFNDFFHFFFNFF